MMTSWEKAKQKRIRQDKTESLQMPMVDLTRENWRALKGSNNTHLWKMFYDNSERRKPSLQL